MAATGSGRLVDCDPIITGQSTLRQYADGEAPEAAAVTTAGSGQAYTDPDAGQSGPEQDSGLTEAQAMVMADGNEGVASKILEMDQTIQDLSQETQETGNSYLAAAAGDSVKDVMGTLGTTAFGIGAATGNVPLMALSLAGVATLGAFKGVAGEGVTNTVLNLPDNNNSLRAAVKDTLTNTSIGQQITDFRNRSAYGGSGDGTSTDDTKY